LPQQALATHVLHGSAPVLGSLHVW